MNNISKINFFDFEVDNLSMDETISLIDSQIKKNKIIQHVVVNVAKLVNSRKDKILSDSISNADIINIDGAGVVYGMKILGYAPKERVAGIDLMMELLSLAEKNNYSVYFLGAKNVVLEKMITKITSKYPKLLIAGFRNGYWNAKDEKGIVDNISQLNPNILFVGISSPKKEEFIAKYKNDLNCNLVMGVGGSFDVISGLTMRAPKFMQDNGLEWLYRIYQEPRRMWKRYLYTNTIYLFIIMRKLKNRIFK